MDGGSGDSSGPSSRCTRLICIDLELMEVGESNPRLVWWHKDLRVMVTEL